MSRPLGLIILALIGAAALLAVFLLPARPVSLSIRPVAFADLPGFRQSKLPENALKALKRSCAVLLKRSAGYRLHATGLGGTAGHWRPFCTSLQALAARGNSDLASAQSGSLNATLQTTSVSSADGARLKTILQDHLTPYLITSSGGDKGVFTGYYEPLLKGAFQQGGPYQHPLYGLPDDLIQLDLGQFRPALKGQRLAGRVEGKRLIPFADRAEITKKGLKTAKPLLYVDSAIDAFFLHIQGSGRVVLPDGRIQGVGYAAQNGHPYVAIGRVLVKRGILDRKTVSLQSIKAWLLAHPTEGAALLNENPSFIFFRLIDAKDGPFGSGGIPLVARHSLAVDRRFLPLHVPLWLAATHPDPAGPEKPPLPFNSLMVSQDTGGAIRGEIRGDVFWGFGPQAEEIAGRMANRGRYYMLLPKGLAPNRVAPFMARAS